MTYRTPELASPPVGSRWNVSWCICMPSASCLMLFAQAVRREASRAVCTAGSSRATSTPMMAITTNSSTNVKAALARRIKLHRTKLRRIEPSNRKAMPKTTKGCEPSPRSRRAGFTQASLCKLAPAAGQAKPSEKILFLLCRASFWLAEVCLDAINLGITKLIKLVDMAINLRIQIGLPATDQLRQPPGPLPGVAIIGDGYRDRQLSKLPFVDREKTATQTLCRVARCEHVRQQLRVQQSKQIEWIDLALTSCINLHSQCKAAVVPRGLQPPRHPGDDDLGQLKKPPLRWRQLGNIERQTRASVILAQIADIAHANGI